jgi:hypothetical protein
MLLWFIIGCEIGFWIFLFLGCSSGTYLKYPRTGKAVLFCVPLLDLILLFATAIDLHEGTVAEFAHGLAAVYLGFTVVYGSGVIKWLDQYVVYKFASGEKMNEPSTHGWSHAIYELKQWLKGVGAGAIAVISLFCAIKFVNQTEKTQLLHDWFHYIFWFLAMWFVCWPLWYTLFPKKPKS